MSKKLVRGIGINDGGYQVFKQFPEGPDGPKAWNCPYYWQWTNMLSRCTKVWQDRCPWYKGTTVCEEWKTFSVFKKWMLEQDWEGRALDKDIIKDGNKEYGPVCCRFVTQATNSALSKRVRLKTKLDNLPVGVTHYPHAGKNYQTTVGRVTSPFFRKGRFVTLEEAVSFYKEHKAALIRSCLELESDPEIRRGIERAAQALYNK
jgi:hypothetical protein